MDSFNKPFQSGDGLCYPIYAQNYYKTQTSPMFGGKKSQKGGNVIGDYSNPSTPFDYPGNAYLTNPNQRNALTGSGIPQQINPLTEQFLNSNMGITYATQAGGRKKNKKGGVGPNAFNGRVNQLGSTQGENAGTLSRANRQTGGNISSEEEMMTRTSILSNYPPVQGMYPILSGGRYRKYNKKGGNVDMQNQNIPIAPAGMQNNNLYQPEMMMQQPPTMTGGRYKKYSKKGGNIDMQPDMMMQQPDMMMQQQPVMMQQQPVMMQQQPDMMMQQQPDMMMQQQPDMMMQQQPVMMGGRYKKYSKKGGNVDMQQQPQQMMQQQPQQMMQPQPQQMMQPQPQQMMQQQPQPMMQQQPPMVPQQTQQMIQQPSMIQPGPPLPADVMSGGRYKKYSKKGGNYIYTPGANFSYQPAEIATQMDSIAQAQHTPKGGFAMKDMSGVDAQMAASSSFIDVMSGGRKKSSKKLKGGVSDFATTVSSRGPINNPDTLSAQRFRYFNKTGTFIPNSQLQYAAAPISTGYEADPNPYPIAYNDYIGGTVNKKPASAKNKKPASAKNKKPASAKNKKPASDKKKKAASAKKKSASDKKKK